VERRRGRPRAEPVEEQQRRIVAEARRAFSARGYDGVTVAEIAAAANVARPAVYEAVGDKEAILLAVAEQMTAELIDAFDARLAAIEHLDRPLSQVLRDDLAWFVDWIRADPSFVAITRLSGALAAQGPDPVTHARQRMEDRLTELHIERATRWGVDRGESARVISLLVMALAEAIAYRTSREDGWPPEAAAAIAIDFAIGGYLQVEGPGSAAADDFDRLVGRPGGAAGSDAEEAVDAEGEPLG
jgi:AcrR family transcriptional regulator